ncbi:hypothetical protein ACFSCX_21305 [Bacillus salitolerans]|uniref:Uncharacterized protein n=1 Tax=Bacillus salitolerans TaxID=1437434 RepID=A0ABW4LV96_9BACI
MHTTQHGVQQVNHTRQIAQQLLHQTQQGSQQYRMMLQQEQQNIQMLEQILQREKQAAQLIQQSLNDHDLAIQRCQEVVNICNQMQQDLVGTGFQSTIGTFQPGQTMNQQSQNQYQNHANVNTHFQTPFHQ